MGKVLLATALVLALGAGLAAARPEGQTAARTMTIVLKNRDYSSIDLPPTGESLGDLRVGNAELWNRTEKRRVPRGERHAESAANSAPWRLPAGNAPSAAGPNLRSVTTREESMADVRDAEKVLLIEEADAWFEYLEATRAQNEVRYQEIAPWAWSRLRQRLRAIKARRARLRPAAA